MRLVYDKTGIEVKIGDTVSLDDITYKVVCFNKPHKPSSSGKIGVRSLAGNYEREYYVKVIGATWIE